MQIAIAEKRQRARKQIRAECVSTMNGPDEEKKKTEEKKERQFSLIVLKEDEKQRSCGADRAVSSLNSVRGFRQLRMR